MGTCYDFLFRCGLTAYLIALTSWTAQSATIHWSNPSGGAWNSAANWTPAQVPNAGDIAIIDAAGTYTVTAQNSVAAGGLVVGGTGAAPTLRLESTTSFNTLLTVGNSVTNRGIIEILNTSGSGIVTLNVTTGSLVNESNAIIRSLQGSGGGRNLGFQLVNYGTLEIQTTTTLNKASAHHTNSGTITLNGGNFTISQGGTTPIFQNTGAFLVPTGRTNFVVGGTFDLKSSTWGGGGTLDLRNVTLILAGEFSNETTFLDFENVDVNGPGRFINATGRTLPLRSATINTLFENRGTLILRSISALNGSFSNTSDSVTQIESTISFNTAVTVANSFTNNGTIELLNSSGTGVSTLNVTTGPLANAASGIIRTLIGSGGSRTLGFQLENRGLLEVQTQTTLSKSGARHTNFGTLTLTGGNLVINQGGTDPIFVNSGTFSIPPGRTNSITSGTFGFEGGTWGGGGTIGLRNVTLNLTPDLSSADANLEFDNVNVNGPGHLINAESKTLSLNSPVVRTVLENYGTVIFKAIAAIEGSFITGTGSVARVESTISFNSATTLANTFTNRGTIEVLNSTGTGSASLNVAAGTLINMPEGAVRTLPGSGGLRTLGAQLDNRGLIDIQAPTTLAKPSADHVNTGMIDLNGGNLTLIQNGTTPSFLNQGIVRVSVLRTNIVTGGVFGNGTNGILTGSGVLSFTSASITNFGKTAPGTPLGHLTVASAYPFSSNAVLEVEIAGNSSSDYDQLRVTGAAALAGTLRVVLTNDFLPKKGDSFTAVTFPSRTGTFSNLEVVNPTIASWATIYSATNVVLVVTNSAPVLAIGVEQTNILEGSDWTLAVSAVDRDAPEQTVTFSIAGGPLGLRIDSTTGQISWTPTEAQGPSTNTITVTATDNGNPSLSDTKTLTVTVVEVNEAPTLSLPGRDVNELEPLEVTLVANDVDLPINTLSYEIISGPPGTTLNDGRIVWTPTESDGPGSYAFTVRVTDNNPNALNPQHLSATNIFTVAVMEVNSAPVLAPIADQTVHATAPFAMNFSATDGDLPANIHTYEMVNGPSGFSVSSSGTATWTPADSNVGSTNTVQIRVTDNGIPNLSATQAFKLIVVPRPALQQPVISQGQKLIITWSSVAGQTYRLQSVNSLGGPSWVDVQGDVTAVGSSASKEDSMNNLNARFYRVQLVP